MELKIEAQLKTEKTKVVMLESRFDDLADNHEEMIKYKDYHKSSATELRAENEILRNQNQSLFSPQIAEKDNEIQKWKLKNQHLFDQIEKLQISNKAMSGNKKYSRVRL